VAIRIGCSKSDLLSALRIVAVGVPKNKRQRAEVNVEIDLRPDAAEFATIGARSKIACVCTACAKVFLPFAYLLDVVRRWDKDQFVAEIEPGKLIVGLHTLESSRITIVHPENQERIELPLNYTVLDILKLRYSHSPEDLDRMNLLCRVEQAEDELEADAARAERQLSKYGLSAAYLIKLIKGSIHAKALPTE
jgi:hypothetical protein